MHLWGAGPPGLGAAVLRDLTEAVGYRASRIKCRLFDRHDRFCRGRDDHAPDQIERTR